MSDETKSDPMERLRALLLELCPTPDPKSQEDSEARADARIRENRAAQIEFNNKRDALERSLREGFVREQTAATILAELIARGDIESTTEGMVVSDAVRLADALRAELARKP